MDTPIERAAAPTDGCWRCQESLDECRCLALFGPDAPKEEAITYGYVRSRRVIEEGRP